jgi:flagellar biosynthesis protein FlhF
MKVKTFHALTMQDAMRAIKEELGPDAIILSSKEVHQGGRMLRVFNRPVLEVMAACEQDPLRRDEAPKPVAELPSVESPAPAPVVKSFQAALQSVLESNHAPIESAVPEPAGLPKQAAGEKWRRNRLQHLRAELREVSRLLAESLPPETQSIEAGKPPVIARLCRSFVRQGMRPSTAEVLGDDLLERLGPDACRHEEAVTTALQEAIACRIGISGPILGREGGRAIGVILGPCGATESNWGSP